MNQLLNTESHYQFIPPHEGNFWPRALGMFVPGVLRRKYGVTDVEIRGKERVAPLLRDGHGIMLAPNHCRMADALVVQSVAKSIGRPVFIMASSHVFRGSKLLAFVLRRVGAFSVHREGIDREAIQKAISILIEGKRPLVIFPEGALSQTNDRLNSLMEGASFIARSAAAKLDRQAKDGQSSKKVFAVPVAIRYLFKGDLAQTVAPMLAEIERRLSWRTLDHLPLVERIYKVGPALLALKEMEYLGEPQTGELDQRLDRLINSILAPLEAEWFGSDQVGSKQEVSVVSRVKELRKAVLPDMVESSLDERELERRWRQLQDMELAQQLSLYPARYVASKPTVDRILETVDRFTENLSGEEQPHGPLKVVVQIGEPIEVAGKRDRSVEGDPVLQRIESGLTAMLDSLAAECTMYQPAHTASPPNAL